MPARDALIAAFVRAATEVLGTAPEDVAEDTELAADLELDSLDLLEIVMALEEDFDFLAGRDDFADVTTVGDVLDVVAGLAG